MYVKELLLTAFGKCENTKVNFDNGLNIVYGENESGKSTIHKFIEAMFFGFFKDQKSRRAYSDDYYKYDPLFSNSYGGTLLYEDDGNDIRIERNLLKGKDKVIIYEDETGEDISRECYYDPGTKLVMPLDPNIMNRRLYKNTISISQLGCGTDKDLAEELKDRLANFGESKTDLSVQNAIQTLTNELNELGTENRKNTPLYDAYIFLDALQKEKEDIINSSIRIENLLSKGQELDRLLQDAKKSRERLSRQMIAASSSDSVARLHEYSRKIEENKGIVKELSKLSTYHKVSDSDYQKIKKLYDEIQILKRQEESVLEKKNDCTVQIHEIENSIKDKDLFHYKDIQEDYHKMQRLFNEKYILDYKKVDHNCFLLEDKLKDHVSSLKTWRLQMLFGGLATLVGFFLGIMLDPLFYLLCLFLSISIVRYKNIKKKRIEMKAVNEKLNLIKDDIKSADSHLSTIEDNIRAILYKYECKSNEEFVRNYYEKYQALSSEVTGELISLKERKRNYEESIELYQTEKKKIHQEILILFKNNEVATINEFEENLNVFKRIKELESQLQINGALLDTMIHPKELDKIKKLAEQYSSYEKYFVTDDIEALALKRSEIDEEISLLEIEKSNIEGRIDSIAIQKGNLSDIESEISFIENKISKIRSKERSLRLAINTIHQISEEIHKELAPELNKLLGSILKDITKKYESVKVTKDLEIRVEHPVNNQLLNLEQVSSGTIDQVYFSFRLGLHNFLSASNFPILLDEAFVQYDDNRLSNVLKYLLEVANSRQIILFTSQDREIRLIKHLTNKVNVIEL